MEPHGVPYDDVQVIVELCVVLRLNSTYRQVLWREGPQAGQVSPGGGAIKLLNLLYKLLLQAPLLLISLRVGKLHHQR